MLTLINHQKLIDDLFDRLNTLDRAIEFHRGCLRDRNRLCEELVDSASALSRVLAKRQEAGQLYNLFNSFEWVRDAKPND